MTFCCLCYLLFIYAVFAPCSRLKAVLRTAETPVALRKNPLRRPRPGSFDRRRPGDGVFQVPRLPGRLLPFYSPFGENLRKRGAGTAADPCKQWLVDPCDVSLLFGQEAGQALPYLAEHAPHLRILALDTRPESDRVYDFDAGYSRKHALRHFQYDRLAFLYLRYNAIPAGSEVKCLVGPVKSLVESWLPVNDPAFTINGRQVVFPCQLETEQYIEFDGQGDARLYDREGVQIGTVKPIGAIPTLKPGPNEIAFSSAAGTEFSNRAEVIVIRFGEEDKDK